MEGYPIGTKVVRGPSWNWGSQDCIDGVPTVGVIIEGGDPEPGWTYVMWTNGFVECYRIGYGFQDVIPLTSSIPSQSGLPPRNNDGRKNCFWCPGISTQKRGGGKYDVCPKCGK